MSFPVPILFLIFNRPEKTKLVFEKIRQARPKMLFVAADGPRSHKEGEASICEQTRQMVLGQIDWPCQVQTLLRENNVGCKVAVSSAIDWFFSYVEKGIILEDDCRPESSFFTFCKEVLEYYENDYRVMHITGSNFVNETLHMNDSYYFSRFANIWGWATWRRAWQKYDVTMSRFPSFKAAGGYNRVFEDPIIAEYFLEYSENVWQGKVDTWDLQWLFTVLVENGLCVVPSHNLISNIGFGADATHTVTDQTSVSKRSTQNIGQIHHPSCLFPNLQADRVYFDIVHNGKELRKSKTWQGKVKFFFWKVRFKLNLLLHRKQVGQVA